MNTENQELILLTGKMLYQLQMHQKYGNANSLKQAHAYKQKAEAVLSKMDEGCASHICKMYINR